MLDLMQIYTVPPDLVRNSAAIQGIALLLFIWLQILQLVEEGHTDLLQEMLGQRLEFGMWARHEGAQGLGI